MARADEPDPVREVLEHADDAGDVGRLLGQLYDRDQRVAIAAAVKLAEVHDAAVVPPLVHALESNCEGGSVANHLLHSAATVLVIGFGMAGFVHHLPDAARMPWCVYEAGMLLVITFAVRSWRGRVKVRRAILEALHTISNHSDAAELRSLLSPLRALRFEVLGERRENQRLMREILHRVETCTADRQDLPVPAEGSTSGEELPISSREGRPVR